MRHQTTLRVVKQIISPLNLRWSYLVSRIIIPLKYVLKPECWTSTNIPTFLYLHELWKPIRCITFTWLGSAHYRPFVVYS